MSNYSRTATATVSRCLGVQGGWGRFLEPQNPVGKFTLLAEIKICLETEAKENSFMTEVWATVLSAAQTRVGENGSHPEEAKCL